MDELEKFRTSWQEELQENQEPNKTLESKVHKQGTSNSSESSTVAPAKHSPLEPSSTRQLKPSEPCGIPEKTLPEVKYSPFTLVDNLLEGKRILDEGDEIQGEEVQHRKKRKENPTEDKNIFLEALISDLDEMNDIPFFDIEVPREIGIKIFQYLSMQDLCSCAQVSSSWRSLAEDQLLWFPFYKSLGFATKVDVNSEPNWKAAVRDGLMQNDLLMANWKGRIGRVTMLEHVTGGVLCSANSSEGAIIAGFSNGSVKLWKIGKNVEKEIMLYRYYDNSICSPAVKQVSVNSFVSMATYNNGDVEVWSTEHGSDPVHYYHEGHIQCVSLATNQAQIASATGKRLRIEAACNSGIWSTHDTVTLDKQIDDVKLFTVHGNTEQSCHVAMMTVSGLYIYNPSPSSKLLSQVHMFVDSGLPTCMEVLSNHIVCGFGVAGFLESFAVKFFDIETKTVKHVLKGHTWDVKCCHSDDALQSVVATGCLDKRVRVFDLRLRSNRPVMQFSGHWDAVTQVQIDHWKVVSGGLDGMVCLWDQRMQRKLWDSYARHPVRYARFSGSSLVTANIPDIKNLEDDLETVTHKRLRGELRHYNFLADQTREGLPSVCLSNYDEPEGYNYNIRLTAPYDDL